MKCKHCHGTGIVRVHMFDAATPFVDDFCPVCSGTGYVPQTNHERLKELNINDHAKLLSTIAYACMRCGRNHWNGYCPFSRCIAKTEDALTWLQEEH